MINIKHNKQTILFILKDKTKNNNYKTKFTLVL